MHPEKNKILRKRGNLDTDMQRQDARLSLLEQLRQSGMPPAEAPVDEMEMEADTQADVGVEPEIPGARRKRKSSAMPVP